MSALRIGIDLGGTKTSLAALSAGGRQLAYRRWATPAGDYGATVRAIAEAVRREEESLGAAATVGIGIPGTISPATGLVKNANSTWLNGRPLDRDLAAALKRPVRLANDADCFTLSEAIDGAGTGQPVVFGVILGTGVGGGVAVGGRLLTGPNAIAGEWGHNPLPEPPTDETGGRVCWCGRRDCIETYLSGPGLARTARALGGAASDGAASDGAAIGARAAAGDPIARQAIGMYVDQLARALGTVVNLLDPGVIVLGGGVSNLPDLAGRVEEAWRRFIFSDRVDTLIRRHAHGDDSGVRGAAWLWRDETASPETPPSAPGRGHD